MAIVVTIFGSRDVWFPLQWHSSLVVAGGASSLPIGAALCHPSVQLLSERQSQDH